MIDVVPYVDTSALLKLLVAEEESSAFKAYVRDRAPLPLYTSELTTTELLRNVVKNGAHPGAVTCLRPSPRTTRVGPSERGITRGMTPLAPSPVPPTVPGQE